MMPVNTKKVPSWLPYADLLCVIVAWGLWYALPQPGAWPLVLALAPWAMRLATTGRLTRRTRFDLPLALFLFTAGLAVWAAYDRQAAWSKFWLIASGVFLFYALVNADPIAEIRLWVLAFLGTGISLYFLATHNWEMYPAKISALTHLGQSLQALLPPLPHSHRNSNEIGGMLAMLLPFTGLLVAQTWLKRRRIFPRQLIRHRLTLGVSLILLALTSFGLLMTTSRGAWLALASALLLAGLWMAAGWLSRNRMEQRAWIFVGLLTLGVVLALGIGSAWPGKLGVVPDALPGPDTWQSRVGFHRNSWTLVRDYPFIGAGLDGFQMLYSTYVLLTHVGFIPHSHNLYLSVAIDQGLFGLLALIWMWLLFAWAVWRGVLRTLAVQSRASRASASLGVAALSLIVILVHGVADSALYSKEGVLLLFVPLAFAATFPRGQNQRVKRRLTYILLLCSFLLAGTALVRWRPLLSSIYSNLGAVYQSQTELSVYAWPEWPVQDAVRRAVDLSQPIAEFERALSLHSQNATANRRLGMIELSLGKYKDALHHLQAAYAAEPKSATARQLLGEALIANGQVDEGQALWTEVSNTEGQLTLRVFWYRHINDTERAEWMQQAADK